VDPHEVPPETLIAFRGLVPRPIGGAAPRQRARITIELLGLKDREDLQFVRAQVIMGLWFALERCDAGSERKRNAAARAVEAMTGIGAPMSACAVSFLRLYEEKHDAAEEIAEAAIDYALSRTR
jgi:hypothetical protein